MIRGVGVVALLLATAMLIGACGGGSNSGAKATQTSLAAGGAGVKGTAAPGKTSAAGAVGTPGSSVVTQVAGAVGAGAAGTTSAGGNNTPDATGGTSGVTFSTPADTATPASASEVAGTPPPPPTAAPTGPAGGAVAVGAGAFVGGNVEIPVNVVGAGMAPFTAFQVHLRWDASIFKFSSARSTGTVLPGSVLCPAAQVDADGAGVVFACTATGGDSVTTAGLLATIVLQPTGTGCSAFHLFTYGGADKGDEGTGTYTMDKDTKVQLTVTADARVDNTGKSC